jgi:hypothetical protein
MHTVTRKLSIVFSFVAAFRKQQLLTTTNPDVDRLPEFSPSFSCNERSSYKNFSDTLKYTLAEKEITKKQENVILGNENPFGPTLMRQ